MSGYGSEATTIRVRFSDRWGDTTPVAWENLAFDPLRQSGDPDGETVDPAPWVRLTIRTGDAEQVGGAPVGARRFRHVGVVFVQIFTPKGTGDQRARELADEVCAIFRGVTDSGVVFQTPHVEPAGTDDAWYQLTVECPYYRDTLY